MLLTGRPRPTTLVTVAVLLLCFAATVRLVEDRFHAKQASFQSTGPGAQRASAHRHSPVQMRTISTSSPLLPKNNVWGVNTSSLYLAVLRLWCGACRSNKEVAESARVLDAARADPFLNNGLHSDIITVRIACAGDSITVGNESSSHRGSKVERPGEGNYPLELLSGLSCGAVRKARRDADRYQSAVSCFSAQRANQLCIRLEIANFGHSGRTAADSPVRFSYRRSPFFQRLFRFKPHIVFLMLGTNDAKSRSWKNDSYFQDALESVAIQVMGALAGPRTSPVAAMILMAPPPVQQGGSGLPVKFGIRPGVVANNVRRGVQVVAQKIGATFVDHAAAFTQHRSATTGASTPLAQLLHDGVHPSAVGHWLIARTILEELCKVG